MKYLSTIKAVLEILPAMLKVIKELESLFPESGSGKTKLAVIKEALLAADSRVTEMWPVIEKVIGAVVGVFNTFGIFKK